MAKLKMEGELAAQQHQFKLQEMQADHQRDVELAMLELQNRLKEIMAESESDIRGEEAQAAFNMAELRMKSKLDEDKHNNEMEKIRATPLPTSKK